MKVRQSATDPNLFLLTDARVDALDASLSQLNLFDKSHTDVLWKAIHDLKKEPYVTTMSIFSKITDKLIFRLAHFTPFYLTYTNKQLCLLFSILQRKYRF